MFKNKIKKKELYKDKLFSLFFALLLLIIIFYLIISNLKIEERKSELDQKVTQLKEKFEFLGENNERLKGGVSQTLRSDYAEEVLREKGLYKRKGEKIVVILLPEEEKDEIEEKEEESFWEKILRKINLRD